MAGKVTLTGSGIRMQTPLGAITQPQHAASSSTKFKGLLLLRYLKFYGSFHSKGNSATYSCILRLVYEAAKLGTVGIAKAFGGKCTQLPHRDLEALLLPTSDMDPAPGPWDPRLASQDGRAYVSGHFA